MTWAKEKPTKPGWYIVKLQFTELVRVINATGGLWVNRHQQFVADYADDSWWLPIPDPPESQT